MNNTIVNLVKDEYLYMIDYNQVINASMKDEFLKLGRDRKINFRDLNIDEKLIRKRIKKLPHLILEITENCNLRCKYCVYNGNYVNHRNLAPNNMDFETARKGLDYIFSIIKGRKKKEFALGFYGGEPLLNFKTMTRVVEYAKKLFCGWELLFNMTTNLTLLNDAILDFLVENDFLLLVSLDGNKENHDAKRVSSDGQGTYDNVIRNLEKIAERDMDYFQEKVGFSTVHSPDLPLKNLHEFFSTNDLVKKRRMRFSTVDIFNTTYYEKYPYDKKRFQKESEEIFSQLLDKLRQGEELSKFENFLYVTFKGIGDSIRARKYSVLGTTCLFDDRLYLDARGRFHVCEKINNTFPFGDVENGFDFEKMAAMARDFCEVVKTHCLNCDIRFLCKQCYVQFAGNGEFRLNLEYCKTQKDYLMKNLEKYIECKEEAIV